jgi:hypothetical protein
MRITAPHVALIAGLAAGLVLAVPIRLDPSTRYALTNCAAAGSASQTVARGKYLATTHDEEVWLCYADGLPDGGSGCQADAGVRLPQGIAFELDIPSAAGQAVSCRSVSGTGDIELTKVTQY